MVNISERIFSCRGLMNDLDVSIDYEFSREVHDKIDDNIYYGINNFGKIGIRSIISEKVK